MEYYEYDVFGEPTIWDVGTMEIISSSGVGNPYMFTGRRYDSEFGIGLYYYRARFYRPHIGRFLQTDPIGYYAGLNLYAYVGNNPLNWLDPWGLCKHGNKGGKRGGGSNPPPAPVQLEEEIYDILARAIMWNQNENEGWRWGNQCAEQAMRLKNSLPAYKYLDVEIEGRAKHRLVPWYFWDIGFPRNHTVIKVTTPYGTFIIDPYRGLWKTATGNKDIKVEPYDEFYPKYPYKQGETVW